MNDYTLKKLSTWLKIDATRELRLKYDAVDTQYHAYLHVRGRQLYATSANLVKAVEYVVEHVPYVPMVGSTYDNNVIVEKKRGY